MNNSQSLNENESAKSTTRIPALDDGQRGAEVSSARTKPVMFEFDAGSAFTLADLEARGLQFAYIGIRGIRPSRYIIIPLPSRYGLSMGVPVSIDDHGLCLPNP